MSIFATTLGERPVPPHQVTSAVIEAITMSHTPAMTATLGGRPIGVCPAEVDWTGTLTGSPNEVGAWMPPSPPLSAAPSSAEVLAAIDTALRQNSARVTIHGLFDIDE